MSHGNSNLGSTGGNILGGLLKGGLGGVLSGGALPILGALGGLFGGAANAAEVEQTRDDIRGMAAFTDQSFGGPGGAGFANADGTSGFTLDAQGQQFRGNLGQQGNQLLQGGLFNDPRLQAALGQNDIAGALGQSNQLNQQQLGTQAFGGLGGLFGQAQGLAGQFGAQAAAGPQDFTGGLQQGLFGQGFSNQQQAGNQQALFDKSLASQRAAFEPQQNRAFNKLQDRQFAQGRLGSTGGSQETEGFFNAANQADLGFQNNAFGQAFQQQQFLGNLGSQQISQGAGLLGQNLGQFNQAASNAQGFLGLAGGLEGQGFGQNLQALQQNQSAGNQRLQNATNLFGLGSQTFGQQFGLGLDAFGATQQQNQFGLDSQLGFRNAEANRIGATGQHAQALADVQSSAGGVFGDFIGGLF